MMADLVNQHMGDDRAERVLALAPEIEQRTAIEPDHVGQRAGLRRPPDDAPGRGRETGRAGRIRSRRSISSSVSSSGKSTTWMTRPSQRRRKRRGQLREGGLGERVDIGGGGGARGGEREVRASVIGALRRRTEVSGPQTSLARRSLSKARSAGREEADRNSEARRIAGERHGRTVLHSRQRRSQARRGDGAASVLAVARGRLRCAGGRGAGRAAAGPLRADRRSKAITTAPSMPIPPSHRVVAARATSSRTAARASRRAGRRIRARGRRRRRAP